MALIQTARNLWFELTLESIRVARLNSGAYHAGTNSHEEHGHPRRWPRGRHPIVHLSFISAAQNAHSEREFEIECQCHVDGEVPVTLPLRKNQKPANQMF